MKLYKIQQRSPYVRRFRVFGGAIILMLLGTCCLALYDPLDLSDSIRRLLADFAIGAAGLVIVAVAVFSYFEGLWKLKSRSEFEISPDKIIETRLEARSTLEIPLNNIKSMSQRSGWLVIDSADPPKRMMVPQEVDGFDELKAELSSHHELKSSDPTGSAWSFLPILLLIGACGLLFLGRSFSVILAGASLLLFLEGWGFYALVRIHRTRPIPRFLVLVWIATLLAICWITYGRVHAFLLS
jgi:hypothetical protein